MTSKNNSLLCIAQFQLPDGYIHWTMDNIIPNHKRLSRTELDTKKRPTPFSKKSRPCAKKPTKPNALLQKKKKKQTNPLFEDKNHNKVTFKRLDFYSANVFRNLKAAFNSVRAIISKWFFLYFCINLIVF